MRRIKSIGAIVVLVLSLLTSVSQPVDMAGETPREDLWDDRGGIVIVDRTMGLDEKKGPVMTGKQALYQAIKERGGQNQIGISRQKSRRLHCGRMGSPGVFRGAQSNWEHGDHSGSLSSRTASAIFCCSY